MRRSIRTAIIGLALINSGVAWAQAVPPYGPIPPPRYEVVPPPPSAQYIWQPGHWHWDGYRYAWVGGHYVIRQPHYAAYVPGRWEHHGPNWVWVPAHWR
jgi:hypothetical protein